MAFLCVSFVDVIKLRDYVVNSPINMLDSRVYSRKPNYKGLLDTDECHTNQIIDSNLENHQQNHYMENS